MSICISAFLSVYNFEPKRYAYSQAIANATKRFCYHFGTVTLNSTESVKFFLPLLFSLQSCIPKCYLLGHSL